MLQLLGRANSINVRKVLWLLDELALPFVHEAWGAGHRDPRVPAFLTLNPNALVPVLIDGDFVLWESNTICRYLATRERRHDLLPADAQGRARVEQWMDWQATELNGAWRYAFMARVRHHPAYQDAAAIDSSVAEWNRHMALLDAQIARTGAHVVGADFTLADIVLGLATQRWFASPIERPSLSAVEAYYERLSQRAPYRAHGRNGVP